MILLLLDCPYTKSDISRLQKVLLTATTIIDQGGDTRTAPKALKVLSDHVDQLVQVVTDKRSKRSHQGGEDFTFTYEEESDPEVFFVP
jgi:hypothetical protein